MNGENQESSSCIDKNTQFILSHFKSQEFIFPRAIMTANTNGQVYVNSQDEMMKYFAEANFIDCRINGYPFYYEQDDNKLHPSFIYISLDLSLCNSCKYPIRKLDYILKQTLHKIQQEINGHPTVLWTGGGYHIYQPIKIVNNNPQEEISLESISYYNQFLPYMKNDFTSQFIRFACEYFTNGKNNSNYDLTTKSCLVHIPESLNSKYHEKVRIVQNWDGKEDDIKSILPCFYDSLIQRSSMIWIEID
jgi:hypothetical protein